MSFVPKTLRADIDSLSRRWRIAILVAVAGFAAAVIAIAMGGASFQPLLDFYRNGTLLTERQGLDLIEGAGITISIADLSNRVGYTISTSGAGASGYSTIQDEGSPLTQRSILNFIGAGVSCVDDTVDSSDCTISGGGSTNSFETIDAPSGTDPVADSATDTLQLLVTGTDLSITGDSTLDRLTFDILTNAGTDITADLEEEAHASEHAIGGADEVAFYGLIDDEGTPLTARRTLNFIGTGVSCVDDPGGSETDCTITSSSTQNLFETINIPGAEDSVADNATDILNFTESAGIDITGTAATDTINFAFDVLEVTLTNDTFWLGSSGNLAVEATIPDCVDTSGNHLNYTQSTNTLSCGTSSGLLTVEESDASPITVNVFDFGAGFDISESPTDEANITLDILEIALTNDSLWVGSASSLAAETGLPNCTDIGGNHLNYTQSSNSFTCGTSGDGFGDLQQTYNAEVAPALITLTDVLGGIIFEGDAEATDATLTIRDSGTNKLGLVLDNDNESSNETSPVLRLINSTSAGGDNQFSIAVTGSGVFEIRGDDGSVDLSIDTIGQVGIGTESPSSILVIQPTTNADRIRLTESDSALSAIDLISFTGGGQVTVSAGGVTDIVLNALGTSIFNDGGFPEHDFRIEGGTDQNLFFVDAGANAIGIGDPTPDDLLNVHSATSQSAIAITSLGTNTDALLKFELIDGTASFTLGVDDSDGDRFKISTTALGTSDRLVLHTLDSSLFADAAASESGAGATGAVGGDLTAIAGAGAEVTGGGASTGGIGGILTLTAGAGGASTTLNVGDTAGAGGVASLTAGQGGPGASGITPGIGGILTLTAGAGNGGSITIGSSGGAASLVGGIGGNSDGTNLFAGDGGATNLIGGAGGSANDAGGGDGGTITVRSGAGGAGGISVGNGDGGDGGNLILDSGSGGAAGGGVAGANGTISLGTTNATTITIGNTSSTLIGAGIFDLDSVVISSTNALVFEGLTANDFETTFAITDPTVDRTITFPNATGTVIIQAYTTIDDEGTPLTQQSTLNFIGAGVTCVNDGPGSETDCTIPGGAGGEDLQGTYDLETAPALITLTDVLGGITFEGDAEVTESTLTIRDSTANKLGLVLDNDNEASNETSPLLRLINSTSAAGDDQFTFAVTGSGIFEIRGDDDAVDFSIDLSGNVLLPDGTSTSNALALGAGADSRIYYDGANTFWDLQSVGTGALMIALAGSFPSPDSGVVHIWKGNAGVASAGGSGAALAIEDDSNVFITFLTPSTTISGLTWERPTDTNTGAFLYDQSNDRFEFRLVNNTARLLYSAGALAFQEATTISTTVGNLTLNPTADLVVQSNALTLGLGTATNPVLTFDTDEATDASILFDAVTDNRFETNKPWDFSANNITLTGTVDGVDLNNPGNGIELSGSQYSIDLNTTLDGVGSASNLSGLEFTATAELALLQGCADNQILKWDETPATWNCEADTSGGSVDLQGVYDNEVAPALITLTDALGGITFEGDAEVTESTLTIRDSTANKLGLVLDNDDEVATEQSPLFRLINSTAGAGDTQFDFVVTAADPGSLEIRGDDGVADLTIDSSGNIVGVLDITATTIASITVGNLVDKSATEVIAGAWSFTIGITLGDNTDANRSITWDTLTADNTLTYDEITDNRFEFSAGVDSTGAITESGNAIANSTEEGILDADVFATCDVTSDDLVDSNCIEQNAGTDISADLEEESHDTEHASGGNDDLFHERAAVWVQANDVDLVMDIEDIRMYADASGTIKDVRCSVNSAPTGSVVTIDLNKNGTTIFTTQGNRPSIAIGNFTDVSGTPDVTAYVAGDEFRIEIDAVDSGDTASDLTCQMRVRESLFATS